MNEIRPFNTIVIMISDEVRWRKDRRCTELQLLTSYFTESERVKQNERSETNIAKY